MKFVHIFPLYSHDNNCQAVVAILCGLCIMEVYELFRNNFNCLRCYWIGYHISVSTHSVCDTYWAYDNRAKSMIIIAFIVPLIIIAVLYAVWFSLINGLNPHDDF